MSCPRYGYRDWLEVTSLSPKLLCHATYYGMTMLGRPWWSVPWQDMLEGKLDGFIE